MLIMISFIYYFNSQPHKGADSAILFSPFSYRISIHSPTRGLTETYFGKYGGANISIHSPTRGLTIPYPSFVSDMFISIHSPTRGLTFLTFETSGYYSYFNSQPHKGADT